MNNLNKFSVQELSSQEIRKTNGGGFGLTLGIVALCIAVLNTDWDKAADDFKRGYNS